MPAVLEKPTKKAQKFAQNTIGELKKLIGKKKASPQVFLSFQSKEKEESFEIPLDILIHFQNLLDKIADGYVVQILALDSELSTQEAAEILKISRPSVIKLLEEGKIPFKMVGTHRRIKLQDLQGYEREQKGIRGKALDEMVRLSQELGLYEEP